MSTISEKFSAKTKANRDALMTPEAEKIEKEMYKLIDKLDGAFGAFEYQGQIWTTYPPEDRDFAYHLVAAQIACLAQAYGKSPTVIMAEVNAAIKDVMK